MINGQDLRRMLQLRKDTCVDQGIDTAGENVQRGMLINNQLLIMEALRCLLKDDDRCRTCTHWVVLNRQVRKCVCPKMVYGYGKDTTDPDGVAIEDDEGWGMIPNPQFGCIHHNSKENADEEATDERTAGQQDEAA